MYDASTDERGDRRCWRSGDPLGPTRLASQKIRRSVGLTVSELPKNVKTVYGGSTVHLRANFAK